MSFYKKDYLYDSIDKTGIKIQKKSYAILNNNIYNF